MHEILYVTSGCRTPVVMAIANRALSSPINIHCDHADSMVERDSGWIQIYVEDSQEAYDSIIQAFRIAEHPDVLLPVMICLDAFVISHTLENVQIFPEEIVQKFVGSRQIPEITATEGRRVPLKLDPSNPITIGPLALYDYYFEHKRQQEDAMRRAKRVIQEVHKEYSDLSGRKYGNGLIDTYHLEDADVAIVCVGSTAGTTKTVVDQIRAEGVKAGLLRLRSFRPIPTADILLALKKVKGVAVLDRSISFGGGGGPIFHELRHVLYDTPAHPHVLDYIYGLGGRDMAQQTIHSIFTDLQRIVDTNSTEEIVRFAGLRE